MRGKKFAETVGNAVSRRVGRAASRFQEVTPLAVDILESDDEYLMIFDAPGVAVSDVQVNCDGRTVQVRIDRFRKYYEGFSMRFPGRGLSLDGQATLPSGPAIDNENAHAKLQDDGTLYVFVPKKTDGNESIPVESEPDESEPDETEPSAENELTDENATTDTTRDSSDVDE